MDVVEHFCKYFFKASNITQTRVQNAEFDWTTFLTAFWLSYDQLWAILKGTTSLT